MYPYHSDWPEAKSLSAAVGLPYFKALFQKPFSTYLLTVIAMRDGRPNLINCVIPKTNVDLVSYSAWDTVVDHRDNPSVFREALDFIAKNTPDHPELGDKNVYVGEFGLPENEFSAEELQKAIQSTVQISLEWGTRYIIYWQLYCNECKNPDTKAPVTNNQDVRGFWLIRPDGSKSWTWNYFHDLLNQ